MPLIGLISDTHNFLDPQVITEFAGVDRILHAGDIGLPWILLELEQVAPVTAVVGNTDVGLTYRETEVVDVLGKRLLLHHIVDPHRLDDRLRRQVATVRPDVVVYGHTHRPHAEQVNGIWFVNPGSAGHGRFGTPRSIALLRWAGDDRGELEVDFRNLERP